MMSGRMLVVHDLETVRMAFRALNESGSGYISYKQLKYLITNIGDKLTDQEAEDLLADKSDGGVTKAKVFMEMLASSGTSASAMVIIDLIKEGKISGDRDAALALTKVIPRNEHIVKGNPFTFHFSPFYSTIQSGFNHDSFVLLLLITCLPSY